MKRVLYGVAVLALAAGQVLAADTDNENSDAGAPQAPAAAPAAEPSAPLQLKIGDTTIMPVGFMDLTASWKDKNAGGGQGVGLGAGGGWLDGY